MIRLFIAGEQMELLETKDYLSLLQTMLKLFKDDQDYTVTIAPKPLGQPGEEK